MAKQINLENRVLIGRKLAKAREDTGMTQTEASIKIFGITAKNRISEIESGKTLPDAELLQVMCKVYVKNANWILGFSISPELNETEAIAGVLSNSIHDMLCESVLAAAAQISMLCARHIKSFPKALSVQLLQQAKLVAKQFYQLDKDAQTKLQPFMCDLIEIITECDKQQAVQFNHLAQGLDDVFDHDENDITERNLIDLQKLKNVRLPQSCLPRHADIAKPQPDIFEDE